jgi:YVTN family beta-propeller protein
LPRLIGISCLLIVILAAAGPPAGTRPALRSESGLSVLPGGREITPLGEQFFTGPGPFGLAVSPDGRTVVTADGGPNRYALTLLDNTARPTVRHLNTTRRRGSDDGDDDEWHSVFMGLAFDGNDTLYAAEGESGRIRRVEVSSGKNSTLVDLNRNGYRDSYSADLAFDAPRGLLYAVDQANFRVAVIDVRRRAVVSSLHTGRLPFAIALAPSGKQVYVTHVGMFEYQAIPGADTKRPETGLPFPAFGFPSVDAVRGARRPTGQGEIDVPGLGEPNTPAGNSVAVIDVADPAAPRLLAQVPTGLPVSGRVAGGSSPSGVIASTSAIYVSNANQDSISVVDARTLRRAPDIPLRIAGYPDLRGVLPIGIAFTPDGRRLLVAEAGINAIGVVDVASRRVVGHIPAGWFPTQVKLAGETVFVSNAKGHGTGPNADRQAALARSFQGELRRGTLSRWPLAAAADLEKQTAQVLANNGLASPSAEAALPPIEHVVLIVKENRTYDEVFGDLPAAANGAREGAPALARWGDRVTPNHHAMARRWASSDNFYADSEVSVDGHHWLAGSYPNAWTTSSLMAAYGGQKSFRLPTSAPGRLLFAGSDSSIHPEEQLEAGALWHHLERHGVTFRNFGEGFELAGVSEAENLEPTGARFFTNVPMPDPLYRNTSRQYPGFNMNIPDQYRASQFMAEIEERFVKTATPLPRFLFLHLPNDHTARARPDAGYPSEGSYVADNDLALGRIVEYLSHSPWWPKMAIFITEDDAQSGVDHVDSHRTVLLVAGPYARANYSSHLNTSFPGLLKTVFRLLHLPPLNLYDATAADLADCFTTEPDRTPYAALPVDRALFDPAKARRIPGEPPGPKMDDPAELRRQHQRQQQRP